MTYTIINLEQGTAAWLDWRSQGIGASDAPAIMGENPWKTPTQLLQEKCSVSQSGWTAAMQRGTELEPEARRRYEQTVGVNVSPACLQSTQHAWLRASVDGIAPDGSRVVEIKCGDKVYQKTASSRQVPGYYYGQLQHILAVTGLGGIDFWCYLPSRPEVHVHVPRDDGYISRLLETEQKFWNVLAACRQS